MIAGRIPEGPHQVPVFITRLVSRLVDACDPEEIRLFGSYAKGLAGRASDVDLILIFRADPTMAVRHAAFDASRAAIGVDVLLYSRADVTADSDPHGFLGSALRSSRQLYVRPISA